MTPIIRRGVSWKFSIYPEKYTKKLKFFQFLAPKKIRKGSEASETFRLYPYDAGNSSSSPDVVIFGEIENF